MFTRCARSLFTTVTLLVVLAGSSALAASSMRRATTRAQTSASDVARIARRIHRKPGVAVRQGRSRNKAVTASTVLLGDAVVESQADFLAAGRAEAFELRAETSGLARAVHLYIGANNAATTVLVGIYGNLDGHAGTRLRASSAPASNAGTWTTLPISKLKLVAGATYWLAIMGEGGTLRYRDRAQGPCLSETNARSKLRSMPTTWKVGTVYADCPISAYVSTASPPPVNTAPPVLAGEATAGRMLSASTGSWKGAPTTYAYQWQECNALGVGCLNVSEATNSSLTLSPADVGGTVRSVVTAANEGGSNSADSEPSELITLPPPPAPTNTVLPSITGTAQVGDTLTASTGTWTEAPTSFEYQWEECNPAGKSCTDVNGATASSLQLVPGDAGHTLRVVVTASDAGGSNSAISEVSDAVTPETPPPAPTNTVAPAVSGTAQEGQTLTASNGTWTGAPTAFAYQWQDCGAAGKSCSSIAGATAPTYQLASSDVGHTVRVVVSATNEGGTTAADSQVTAAVAASSEPAPTNTVLPSVSGSAVEGQTLSASTGTWTGSPASFAYQWEDCNTAGAACVNVSGATSASYKLAAGDVGHTLRVVVTASNAGGDAEAASAATATVTPLAPTNTVLPSVSGSAEEGQTLSASTGTWTGSPASFAYQWEDCNAAGGDCVNVSGATSASYKLAAGDVGHTLRVVVTASNAGGTAEAASAATATVTAVVAGQGIYIAQAGAGAQSGEDSCSNAHPLSWLESASNWGSGSGKVAPGTTVNLCGTLTEPIVAHGSGESGKPITLEFAPSARIAMPKCPTSGCIDTNGERYLTIRGTGESQRGLIEDTNQGTGKEEGHITDYLVGIYAEGCEGCTFEYLNVENLYVKTSTADPTEAASIEGIRFGGSNITIAHDTFNNVGWALYSNWVANNGPVHIEHNVFTRVGHGFASTSAFRSAQTIVGPIIFAHNEIYDQKPWDSTNGVNHQDGLHCFRSADSGTVAPHYDGFYIYDNRIGPETGIYMNSSFYLEGTTGPACADGSSKLWVFDNVTVRNEDPVNGGGQGGLYMGTGEDRAYNNTFIGPEDAEAGGVCVAVQNVSENDRFKNNIVTRCGKLIEGGKSYFAAEGLNHNLYAGGDGNNFICGGEQQSALSYWRSCTGQDTEGTKDESSNAKIKMSQREEDGKLESGSAAEGAGVNLTSECETLPTEVATACEENILGEPRPKTGAWNIGAY
jgi:hypothetical protein